MENVKVGLGLEDGLHGGAEGMVNHPIAEGGGGDHPGLRVPNREGMEGAGLVAALPQLTLKLQDLPLQLAEEGGASRRAAHPTRSAERRGSQGPEVGGGVKEGAHQSSPCA
jgi:hypothetical protein